MMANDGYESGSQDFSTEVSKPAPPRDQRGAIIPNNKPTPLFRERTLEGEAARDNVADTRERRAADGWVDEGEEVSGRRGSGQGQRFGQQGAGQAESGDGLGIRGDGRSGDAEGAGSAAGGRRRDLQARPGDGEFDLEEPEQFGADDEGADDSDGAQAVASDSDREPERDAETGERYEITVDGKIHHVSLEEALRGYTREATFHQRMQQLANVRNEIENENGRLRQNWAIWHQARANYEEDVRNMMPAEPNWELEFQRNPAGAWEHQKVFQQLYARLAQSRNMRAQREAAEAEEADRRLEQYAVNGFAQFLADNKISERDMQKHLRLMRRTATNVGFTDYEVATVYDPRMLTVLLMASKYVGMQAAKPRAVIPDKGRTVPPGSATPLSLGNGSRKGIDEAQRRLAASGRLDDAAEVFRRLF
jgi:hypothetical protein